MPAHGVFDKSKRGGMINPIRWLSAVFLFLLATPQASTAQTSAGNPNDANAALHLLTPRYPMPYSPVHAEKIVDALGRIRNCLETSTPANIINLQTMMRTPDSARIDGNSSFRPGSFRLVLLSFNDCATL